MASFGRRLQITAVGQGSTRFSARFSGAGPRAAARSTPSGLQLPGGVAQASMIRPANTDSIPDFQAIGFRFQLGASLSCAACCFPLQGVYASMASRAWPRVSFMRCTSLMRLPPSIASAPLWQRGSSLEFACPLHEEELMCPLCACTWSPSRFGDVSTMALAPCRISFGQTASLSLPGDYLALECARGLPLFLGMTLWISLTSTIT